MMRLVETVWLVFFLVGLLLLGVLGTWTETAPFWYGAGLVSVAGIGALISRQGFPAQAVHWKAVLLMAALAAYLGWRGFTSEVRWLARQDLVFAGTAVVVYGLMAVRFTSDRARLAVLAVLWLLIAGNTAAGLYQYFGDIRWTVFRWAGLNRTGEWTAGGFFENSNHMAGFMTMAGLPLLGVTVLGRGLPGVIRGLAGLGFLIAGTGVAFTTSRAGAVSFLTAMAVFGLATGILWKGGRHRDAGRMGWWLVGLGVAFAGLLAGAGVAIKKFFGPATDLTSLGIRRPMWDAALEQWQVAPFLGTGARSYEYMERGFRTLETKWMTHVGEVDAIFAHNDYLQCLADYGLIGLGLMLLVTAIHVWGALRAVLEASSRAPLGRGEGLAAGLAVGGVAAIAGVMTHALLEFNLHVGINAVMAGLVLGFLATPGFPRAVDAAAPKGAAGAPPKVKAGSGICGRRLATAGVMAAVSLILLEAGWRLAPADFAWRQGKKELNTAVSLSELIATSGTFQRATTLDPENAQAWYMRGRVSLQIASLTAEKYATPFYEASLTQLEQALAKYPQYPYAAAYAGCVAGYLGRTDAAEAHFRTALRWGQNVQSVNELYGDFLMFDRKDYEKAIGYLSTALHLSNSLEVRGNIDRKLRFCVKRLKP